MCPTKKSSIAIKKIADQLSDLAKDLDQGKLRIASSLIDIGPPVFFKTKQKIKDGRAYFTLSFQAPVIDADQTLDEIPPATKAAAAKAASSMPPQAKSTDDKPPEAAKLKKDIARQLKGMVKSFNDNIAPTPIEAKKLLKACDDYNLFADRQWRDDWQACCLVVQRCVKAALAGDFANALELADEINRLTKVCHKKYK
ncbi:MAG: hypothetical protein OEY01_12230 [Desulfobulbaceae bacterium]|nr:hypothetical protein [Desulfobulbaceae bacterium]